MDYDLIVVGGGPAGYVGAIRAAQLGKRVICIDKERAGGTCLNWGCIPTKALLKSAEVYRWIKRADEFGLTVSNVAVDFAKVVKRSRNISDRMAKGIEFLFKNKKIEYLVGQAQIAADRHVHVKMADGTSKDLIGKNILVATGVTQRPLPGLSVDKTTIITSREALVLEAIPQSIAIVGAGAVGVEFAYLFNAFGAKVTLIEMMPQIVPNEDAEVAELLKREFQKSGIDVCVNTKVSSAQIGSSAQLILSGETEKTIAVEKVLVAVGMQANLAGVFADGAQVALDERGYIKVDDRYQTSAAGVFAAGDIIGPPLLAHVASHESIEAVEGMFVPDKQPQRVKRFPGCTYCQPQIASVGLTEGKAKEKGLKFKVGKYPYRGSGRAVTGGEPEGFVKLIVGEPRGEILGAHIIGTEATELIGELGLAMTVDATVKEIYHTIHAHPTLGEMIAEASLATEGRALHL